MSVKVTKTHTVTISGPRLTLADLRELVAECADLSETCEVRVASYSDQRDGSSHTITVHGK